MPGGYKPTGYRFPLVVTVYAGLLLLIGFGGGALLVVLAVSVIVTVTAGLGVIVGLTLGSSNEAAKWRTPTAKAVLGMEKAKKELRSAREDLASLAARNEMLSGLVAKDPALLAELDDFHAWRSEDPDAVQDQAIANVSRGQR